MRRGGRTRSGRWASALLLNGSIVALWVATFLLARVLEHAPHASLWFPPAAVTFAAMLVVGPRALPALFASCALATYIAELQYTDAVRPGVLFVSSLAFAIVHCAAYGLPALVLRRDARRQPADVTLGSVTRFILLGVVAAGLAAVGGVVALSATGLIATDAPGGLVAAWWIGDFVALLTLGPLFIRWMVRLIGMAGMHGASRHIPFRTDDAPTSRTAAMKLGAMALVTVAMLAAATALDERSLLMALLVVPLVLQLWVVHSESRSAALHGVVLFGLVTVGMGALFDTGVDVLALQFAVIGLAANTYFGLAVPALYASNERLREQVTRDPLTRVMTRAYFEERATQELERSHAAGRPAAIVMFDLDRLKHINDTHGHAAGDAVLAELATRCAAAVRPGDLIGRLGGDEFAVFLPDADGDTADAVVQRMQAALHAGPFAGPVGMVDASFGRAVSGPGHLALDELMRTADAAMYGAKRSAGRARGAP